MPVYQIKYSGDGHTSLRDLEWESIEEDSLEAAKLQAEIFAKEEYAWDHSIEDLLEECSGQYEDALQLYIDDEQSTIEYDAREVKDD